VVVSSPSGGPPSVGRSAPKVIHSLTAPRTVSPKRRHAGSHTAASGTTKRLGRHGTEPAAPVLMYHVIAAPPPGARFPGLYVPAAEFAAQVAALAVAGFHAVTLDQLEAHWQHDVPLPAGRPIVLTFDNGYRSQYTRALPILHRLHWRGDLNLQLSGLPPSQGGLSQTQVRRLVAAGWELDSQTFSHPDLTTLNPAQLHYQVAVARTVIQRRYHVPADWFCYPSGRYNPTVEAAVKQAGYVGSTTTIPGWAHPNEDPYRLERIRVLSGTSPQALLSLCQAQLKSAPVCAVEKCTTARRLRWWPPVRRSRGATEPERRA
jgi:peptidoglycan/xylan/chitin deacetylase (PgdA/CDA1 family)